MDLFRDKLSHLLNIDRDNVDVFSVQLRRVHPPLTDVRFAAHGLLYYKPVRLNGIVLMHREEVNIALENDKKILHTLNCCFGGKVSKLLRSNEQSAKPYL